MSVSPSAYEPGSEDGFGELVQDLRNGLEKSVRETDVYRRYEAAVVDEAHRRMAIWCAGRVVHIVGGQRSDWADEVRMATGAAEVRWHESEKSKSPKITWADALHGDRDIVVVLTDQIGHDTSVPLKRRCDARGVPHVPASWGQRSVEAALAEAAPVATSD